RTLVRRTLVPFVAQPCDGCRHATSNWCLPPRSNARTMCSRHIHNQGPLTDPLTCRFRELPESERGNMMADIHEMPDRDGRADLTPRQEKVLHVIRDSVDQRGYPPSLREIGTAVQLASPSSVAYQLRML